MSDIFEKYKDWKVIFYTDNENDEMEVNNVDFTLEDLYQAFKERLYKEKREEFFKKGIHAQSDFIKHFQDEGSGD